MIELKRNYPPSPLISDLDGLRERANTGGNRHRRPNSSSDQRNGGATTTSPFRSLKRLPTRYLLHTAIALVIPLAFALSQLPAQPIVETQGTTAPLVESPLNLGPISLDTTANADSRVGDPPLAEDAAMPVPLSLTSRSEALAPLIIPATISGDVVKLRNGPGLDYDEVARLDGGAPVQVLGRYGEWLQVRQGVDQPTYWIAGELVNLPEAALYTLFQVAQENIPLPPPPKVGRVSQEGLNLRDGPGTNYVSMSKLDAGTEFSLVEQYQNWFYISNGSTEGWVSAEFLDVVPGVLERVPVSATIPDPNPAMVGTINENSVNLRKGPGSAYDRVDKADANTTLDVVARYKDWYQVQLSSGTKAWVFSDLLNLKPMVARRVPTTNNIPALPVRTAPVQSSSSSSSSSSAAQPAAPSGGSAAAVPASGDVAGFATQFVGYRYTWGGASPSSGFDCSGFTSYVYRQYGVNLPHSAAAQYSSGYGAIVGSMSNLAPGDLVFFAGTSGPGISHVAVYIGGGRVVHAMTPSYGVQVSNIWSSYWQNHYYGAIRVRR